MILPQIFSRWSGNVLLLLGLVPAALYAQANYAPPYTFTTHAGALNQFGATNGTLTNARFKSPAGVARDAAGNIYVSDRTAITIRKITPAGVVSTFAGTDGLAGETDGPGSTALFEVPMGLAVDSAGNVFVCEQGRNTIRKITPAGVVSTFAGVARFGDSIDGTGPGAKFDQPWGIAIDSADNLYVTDVNSRNVRKITPAGVVTTLAGLVRTPGTQDGTGTDARFISPAGITVDAAGNVYVSDFGAHNIRKITPAGVVTTFAGETGVSGYVDGVGTAARFTLPNGLTVDPAGNLYVSTSAAIRKVSPSGVVTTIGGSTMTGGVNGLGGDARFSDPVQLMIDPAGALYIADYNNNCLRKGTLLADNFTTLAGSAGLIGDTDGTGAAARFKYPYGVAVDAGGNTYVSDTYNHTIRKISYSGVVTTIAGLAGDPGYLDGTGAGARFNQPRGLSLDAAGNVYVADTNNSVVRKITSAGLVSTFAGTAGLEGTADGTGAAARFKLPTGLATDPVGNIYVTDTYNFTIRKITAAGVVTTLAGQGGVSGSSDGTGAAARFNSPNGLTADALGNVYVADTSNQTIRKITSGGTVTTLAGTAFSGGTADGLGAAARFYYPYAIAVDPAGTLFVTDTFNSTVRQITSWGLVTTLAGSAGESGSTDGTGTDARFSAPVAIALDSSGAIYLTEEGQTIRKGGITPPPNNSFSSSTALILSGASVHAAGTNLGATSEVGEPLHASVTGGTSVWWSWTAPASGTFTLSTAGSTFDTLLAVYTGLAVTSLTPIASNDNESVAVTTSKLTFTAVSGTVYRFAVDGAKPVNLLPGQGVIALTLAVPAVVRDFDGNGKSDIIWSNNTTGERAMWLMNGGTVAAGASLGTVPTAWKMVGTGDFDGNGKADVLLFNTSTGDRAMWLMDGPTIVSNIYLGNISTAWAISAVGDFNGDGKADIFWSNSVTGDRSMWLMDGGTVATGAYLGGVPIEWKVSGTGDFNGDGKSDIVWTNSTTGERSMWLMDGTTLMTGASLGNVPVAWKFSRVGDFNGDGKADIALSNTSTGDRAMWLMNGPTISSNLYLGNVVVAWTMSATGDFNGDGKADIFWSNSVTGDRSMWLMDGGTVLEGDYLGSVPVEWVQAP